MFQINTRVWLNRLSRKAGKPITLAEIDDATFDGFAEQGFDWIWLLSVWQTGAAGRAVWRGNPQWRAEFKALLPDLSEDDISGSGFAITAYAVSKALGGDAALIRFRETLARRGIKLMLDFVPNHSAPHHPWVRSHPDYYVEGSEEALAASPENYLQVDTDRGPKILAYGRDPNFPGWPDTLQLNYANPELQKARIAELVAIAGKCDGVRCDLAMLLLPNIFQRTWGVTPEAFWPKAIPAVHTKFPDFTFMAEVYWDLEWILQQQGFAYCYDKRLYDRCGTAMPRRFAVICSPGLIARISWCAFLRITTSRAPRLNLRGVGTPRRRSSPSYPPACVFSSRSVRRSAAPDTNPSLPRPGRAEESRDCGFLRQSIAGFKADSGLPRWRLVANPAVAGLARKLDRGRFHCLRLGRGQRLALSRRCQLRRQPGPMPSAAAFFGVSRQAGATDRRDGDGSLRPRRQRNRRSRSLHRSRAVATQRIRAARGLTDHGPTARRRCPGSSCRGVRRYRAGNGAARPERLWERDR
jgi:hypothetical protein